MLYTKVRKKYFCQLRNIAIITSRFGRWLLATPNLRFPPDFPQLLSVGAIAFVGHVALATLPSCALSAGKIPTPKTRTYYCDVPKHHLPSTFAASTTQSPNSSIALIKAICEKPFKSSTRIDAGIIRPSRNNRSRCTPCSSGVSGVNHAEPS